MIMIWCGALAFSAAGCAVIVQNTETQTTTTTASAAEASAAADGEGISILTYEASEPPMSVGEAAWALARSSAVVSMDIASDSTVSEAAFALSSMLYKCDKSEAESALKDLFYNAPSNEARVYALMGIYAFGRTADFNELLNSIDKTAEISAVVGGKPYKVSIEKFFATFKKNPSLFVPASFPPKNLTFEPPASSASQQSSTTTTTTTTTTYSNVAFTAWSPAIWMPDLIFWNPFYRPVVVISHGHRPPHHRIRPPAPRPIPPRPKAPNANPGAKPPAQGKDAPHVKYSPARPKVGSSAKGVKNRQPSASSLSKLDLDAKVYNAPKKTPQPDSAAKPAPKPQTPPKTDSKPQTPPKSAQPNPRGDSASASRSAAPRTSSSASARSFNSRGFSAPKSAPAKVSAPNSAAPRAQPSRRR